MPRMRYLLLAAALLCAAATAHADQIVFAGETTTATSSFGASTSFCVRNTTTEHRRIYATFGDRRYDLGIAAAGAPLCATVDSTHMMGRVYQIGLDSQAETPGAGGTFGHLFSAEMRNR